CKNKEIKTILFYIKRNEKRLLYFDSDKKITPVGLIDLFCSTLYPLHETVYSRSYGFQLSVKTNDLHTLHQFFCDSKETYMSWLKSLSCLCSLATSCLYPTMSSLSSCYYLSRLSIRIIECRPKIENGDCFLCLNDILIAKTSTTNPSQTFLFDKIPLVKQQSAKLSLIFTTQSSDLTLKEELSRFNLDLPSSPINQFLSFDQWYHSTSTSLTFPSTDAECCSKLILSNPHLPLSKISVRLQFAQTFLKLLSSQHQQPLGNYLKQLAKYEIEQIADKICLFRSNSLFTLLIDTYLHSTSSQYGQLILQESITILEENNCLLSENKQLLMVLIKLMLSNFDLYLNFLSRQIRIIFAYLFTQAKIKYPQDKYLPYRTITNLLILRFLGPLLLNKPQQQQDNLHSSLIYLTKMLNTTASLNFNTNKPLSPSQPLDAELNIFLSEQKDVLIQFIDNLIQIDDDPSDLDKIEENDDSVYDYVYFYHLCLQKKQFILTDNENDLQEKDKRQFESNLNQITKTLDNN
ncbi:unnamed protein product, partial [Didymodactylos carnosus]